MHMAAILNFDTTKDHSSQTCFRKMKWFEKKKDDDRCKVITIAKITLCTMCALFVVGVSDCCLTPTQHLFQLYHFQ